MLQLLQKGLKFWEFYQTRFDVKTKISVHPLFFVFLVVLVFQGLFEILVAYLITIFLHEFAHFFVAKKLGYNLNKFTLMPHGISLSGKNELFSTKDEVLIALAGPLCNLIIAILCVALWWVFPVTYNFTNVFVMANWCTALVNVLPIFPFDGGRICLALLSQKTQRLNALKKLKIVGIVVSILFVLMFVLSTFFVANFSVLTLGIFCFVTVLWEDKTSIYQKATFFASKQKALKKGIVIREIAVNDNMLLYKLLSHLKPDVITNFKVVKNDLTVVGEIKEIQIEEILKNYPASTKLKMIV